MTSDIRGASTQEMQSSTQSMSQSYASAIVRGSKPKQVQAIVIDSIEGATNDDYLDEIEKLVNINEIISISNMSGARVGIFLSSAELVEKLSGTTIIVRDKVLTIKALIEKNKRVVISNVQTHIPNEIIIEALQSRGITLVSRMYTIRASLSKPGRSHIQSFRRQVYIKECDEHLLPESIQINYEKTTYWIYLGTGATSCFVCKEVGHIAKVCPNNIPPTMSPIIHTSNSTNETISINTDSTPVPDNLNTQENFSKNIMNDASKAPSESPPIAEKNVTLVPKDAEVVSSLPAMNKTISSVPVSPTTPSASIFNSTTIISAIKRRATKSTISDETDDGIHSSIDNNKEKNDEDLTHRANDKIKFKQPAKKVKVNEPVNDYIAQLEKAESYFVQNEIEAPISFNDLANFLAESVGKSDVTKLAMEFTDNIPNLIKMLENCYSYIEKRNIKNRITRIIKRLGKSSSSHSSLDDISSIEE